MRKTIIAGNWKMNKNPTEAVDFISSIKNNIDVSNCDIVLCTPAIDLLVVRDCLKNTNIKVGAQNIYYEDSGAYTGEISAKMLADSQINYVIVGHSERRQLFNESDEMINKKVQSAIEHQIIPIICVGETLKQRENHIEIEFIRMQIKNALKNVSATSKFVIAYEPIWAIGTGKTATAAQAQDICREIRKVLAEIYDQNTADKIQIQYGGSVNSKNAKELFAMPDIDGGLVGGASLTQDFVSIIKEEI